MTATVRPARENHQPFSALWRFEEGQACAGTKHLGRGRSQRPAHSNKGVGLHRLVSGYEYRTFECAACGETERRLVFREPHRPPIAAPDANTQTFGGSSNHELDVALPVDSPDTSRALLQAEEYSLKRARLSRTWSSVSPNQRVPD